jgi:CBS domain-containing protein
MIASEIMTCHVHTTSPQASVKEVARLLYRERISGVPVIDDKSGQLVGMITESDILKQCVCGDIKVAEIMSRQLTAVDEDTPISEVAVLLAERHIKRVPVMHVGHVVGIVSRADIVQAVAMGELLVRPW